MTAKEKENIDVGSYKESEFYSDVMRVTEGLSDPSLLQILTSQSFPTMLWMRDKGVPWILAYGRQAFEHQGKQRFWGGLIVEAVGGGKGLSDRLFELVERNEIEVFYQTSGTELSVDQHGSIDGITIKSESGFEKISCNSLISYPERSSHRIQQTKFTI